MTHDLPNNIRAYRKARAMTQEQLAEALEKRIHDLQKKKDFARAAAEAEKALIRYPNDFRLVYRCGEMYQLMSLENGDRKSMERAIGLLDRAVLLLPQNTDPEISEYSIQAEIAQCYLAMGKREQGLELLKKYNVGGVHNALIGLTYSTPEPRQPEEAAKYLMKAFGNCATELVRTMTGYVNYYAYAEDYASALDAALWLIRYLESIKTAPDAVSYMDKLRAPYYSECAHLSALLGRMEDAAEYLRKALAIAKAFDAAPVYNFYGIKFCIGETKEATAYDDIGATALEAIENQIQGEDWTEEMRGIWRKVKEEA